MKGLKLEPRCMCVVKMKTRQHYLRKCARRSVDVVAGRAHRAVPRNHE